MRKFAADLWAGVRTGPARAGLAFSSLALGLFAVTVLLATLEALQRQARELVDSFGAGSVVLTRSAEPRWIRRHVDFFRANLGAEAWVSGVKVLPPIPGVDFAVAAADGADLLIDVRLTPRGGTDRLDGLKALSDGRSVVAARVRAVPEDGKANAAVAALLAAAAGLPKSAGAVVSGSTARLKTVEVKENDEVKAGQVVATLDAKDYAAKRDQAQYKVTNTQA